MLRRAILAALALSALPLTGCSFFKSLVGANTVDLEGAEVMAVGVDLRRQQKTICPREQVQMAVFVEAQLKGEKETKKYESWAGRGVMVNKNGKLDFSDFAFGSDLGVFDATGWFTPAGDLLATTQREFELRATYKRRPDKFSLTTHYKPDYSCISGGGRAGGSGSAGSPGGTGGSGQAGGHGEPGIRLEIFATLVKTKFYERLVAVQIEGMTPDFLLISPEQTLSIVASGGHGGAGGPGGQGQRGNNGNSGKPGTNGSPGGPGGAGGHGGAGGPGGEVNLVFDDRFGELAQLFKIDVSGGGGGSGGSGGAGGPGGSGGQGLEGTASGSSGATGSSGSAGAAGTRGRDGRSVTKPGRVADRFRRFSGVTVL